MCMKLPPGDLNSGPYPSHPTSIYTCGVTTAPRVCGGGKIYGIILYRARRISKREFNEGGYVTLLPKVTGLLKTGVQSMT